MRKMTKKARIPLGGMGNGLERSYSEKILLFSITISVKLSESSWFLYRMKPRLYKFPKILKLWSKGRPLWGFERSQSHFQTTTSIIYFMPAKIW